MLRGIFRGWLSGGGDHPPVRVPGLVYAVGDIHGRADLLIEMVDGIMQDAMRIGEGGPPLPEIVVVGDMIDRGPDSRGVLDFLAEMEAWPEVSTAFLIGNHELMLLEFLRDPVRGRTWLQHGGAATLASYGVGWTGEITGADQLLALADALRAAMGAHAGFLERLLPCHVSGNLLFTHAGADPRLAPQDQPIEALVWGTPGFLRQRRADGLWVVHGHAIVERPVIRQGRIAIDTGAWTTGRLTALKVAGTEVTFLGVAGPAAEAGPD